MGLVVLAAVVTGCTAGGATPPSPSPIAPTSTRSIDPEQAEPAVPEAADIVVSGSGFSILDSADVVLFSHRWPDEVGPAVAALEQAFGTAPAFSFREGDETHIADMNLYDWGGFILADAQDLPKAREDYAWPSTATITTTAINDIELRTTERVLVGDSVADIQPRAVSEFKQADGSLILVVELTNPQIDPNAGESTNGIYVTTDPSATSIVEIFAPGLYPGM